MGTLSGWAKRRKLTLDKDQIDAALSGFPVPVYLSAASGIGGTDLTSIFTELGSDANRKKIAVTTSDGTTQCYVEIERWDHANSKAWLHLKAPSIAADADTDLYIYYDSSKADNTDYIGDTGDAVAQAVWDDHFQLVYHMGQDPSGGIGCILDSTVNENHGTPAGSMTAGDLVDGQFGKGLEFDGSNDAVASGSNVSATTALTSEVVGKIISQAAGYKRWFDANYNTGIFLGTEGPANPTTVPVAFSIAGAPILAPTIASTDKSQWHHWVGRFGSGSMQLFKNGAQIGTQSRSATLTPAILTLAKDTTGSSGYTNGIICEVRISDIDRSSAWIKATHAGLFDSLITFGAEETPAQVIEMPADLLVLLDALPLVPPYSLAGTVKEGGSPIARTVRVYKRSDGSLIDETTSNAGDGSFQFAGVPPEPVYVVALDDAGGETYNALIFDRVLPKQVCS